MRFYHGWVIPNQNGYAMNPNLQFKRSIPAAILFAVTLAVFQLPAAAATTALSFYSLTSNDAGAQADGVANLGVEVIDLGGSQVRFKFTNNSSSVLTDVYFDDGTLLGIASISYSSGVSFSQGAAPPNLPGANLATPGFQVSQGFSADADSPIIRNGVSQGEWLAVDFTLLDGKTYQDTLAALALPNGGGTGDLRIGAHVQKFASGGSSESFISNVVSAIPEPGTYAMLLAGIGLVGMMVSRRRFN